MLSRRDVLYVAATVFGAACARRTAPVGQPAPAKPQVVAVTLAISGMT
jgi:hypothetical protein